MWLTSSLKKSRYVQYLCTISASLSYASTGSYSDWPSPTLVKLTTDESYAGIKITPEEASWVASSPLLGNALGGLPAAWLLDKIGRKKTMLLGGVLLFLPWIVLSFPVNGLTMILMRLIGGIGGGFISTVGSIYIGEITDKDIRGKLIVTNLFISTCGSVLILSIGPFVPYIALNALCGSFSLLFTCTFLFAPESPYYLVKINKFDLARKSLSRLQSSAINSEEIDTRFIDIKETVENDMKNKATFKELFLRRDYRKSIGIIIGLRTLQYFCGSMAIHSYMQTIMELTNTNLSSDWISVIYAVIQPPAVLLSAFLVDNLGRKPLLAISSLGGFITLTALGIFFYLQDKTEINLTNVNFFPAISVSLYMIMMSVGTIPLPFVMFGELLATNIKSVGGLIFTVYGGIIAFVATKMFNPVADAFGIYTLFWVFAGCCILGVFFTIFLVPETKKKSFSEIQKKLIAGRNK